MTKDSTVRTRTPCVGICSTTYGDDVCRGCKRFIHEVINWNSFKPEEKEAVWKRLENVKLRQNELILTRGMRRAPNTDRATWPEK